MASINKSFNFRHGVQVDDDDFTVRGGLVGIGTTVPTERLDVRGNAVVSGLTSSISLQVTGVTTLTTVDIGITSIKSGIITASSGIVTYYGDGQYLKFLPTSQWVDIDVGLGFTSIYNTGGNVGVSTNDPRNSFQVGGDPTNFSTGVGINSDGGHIFASGIVTATSFVGEVNAPNFDTNAAGVVVSGIVTATSLQGALTGNVTGNVTGDLTGEVNSSKFDTNPSGIVVTGVATATSFVGDITGDVTGNADSATILATARNIGGVSFNGSADINLPGVNVAGNQNTTGTAANLSGTPNISVGTVTASSLDISGGVDIDGHTDLDNVSISGVTTFTGATTHSGGATVNTHLDVIGLTTLDDVNVSSGATFAAPIDLNSDLDVDGHTNLDNVSIAGVSTFTGDAILNGDVRVGTAMTFSSNGIVVGNNKDLKIGSGLTIASNTDGSHVTFFNNTEVQHILEPNVTSEVWTSEIQIPAGNFFVPQLKILRNTGVELYYENGGIKFATSGVGATVYGQLDITNIVASGIITATTELNSPLIGVGTDVPANDIQVRKSGDAEIQITSDSGIAGLTVGREASTGNVNNAEFRYGGGAGAPYSTPQSLDLVNYGTHNFNYYLSASNPSAVVGDFHWHKGLNNTKLMTLTLSLIHI